MENKTFVFVSSWIAPLRKLTLEERWNVMEAILEHAFNGESTRPLSPIEDMAFEFICADIDRMQNKYKTVCQKRRDAANSRWKGKSTNPDSDIEDGCKSTESNTEYYKTNKDTNTDKNTDTDTKTGNTSATSAGARMRGKIPGMQKPYDESELLSRFFDTSNQASLEALAMKHQVAISDLRRTAEEITIQCKSYESAFPIHASIHVAAECNRRAFQALFHKAYE